MRPWGAVLAGCGLALACGDDPTSRPNLDAGPSSPIPAPDVDDPLAGASASRLFPTDQAPGVEFGACHFASPLAAPNGDAVLATAAGRVAALDPETGAEAWSAALPVPDGRDALAVATPALVEDLLVVAYHVVPDGTTGLSDTRLAHRVAVVDVKAGEIHPDFEPVTIDGQWSTVDGDPIPWSADNALARSELAHARLPGEALGRVYVTMGNARDIQPWHGFAFELNLDAWRRDGAEAAITGDLITTREDDCGPPGMSGSRQRVCGGGLWSPSGWTVIERDDTYEIIFAPGNGQLDIPTENYANTLMKVGPGLEFDPMCSAACDDFDPDAPSRECIESCRNLFVPRIPEGQTFVVESGACDGLGLFECWAGLDYIGGSTPAHLVLPSGTETLLYPTKDGAVYLVDADHLGTLYDREQIVSVCGTPEDTCRADWAGMIVTEPALATVGDVTLALVPTFMFDRTHPAGVVALRVVESSTTGPELDVVWRAPDFSSRAALERFRAHTSRIAFSRDASGLQFAWLTEPRSDTGRLLGIRVWDGEIVADVPMAGSGMRFPEPLVMNDRIYAPSCTRDGTRGWIEGYALSHEASTGR